MKKIYVVHDSKTETYGQPMFLHNKGHAIRSFQEEANREDSLVCKYAEDFTLFEIGEYEEEIGKITSYQAKISIGTAIDFKTQK